MFAVLAVLVIGIVLRFIAPEFGKVGKPEVSFSAEPIFAIGGYTVTNSLLLTVIVTIFLIVFSAVATRRLRRGDEEALTTPRGAQNVIELVIEQLYALMESVNAKYVARFFTLVATIFLIVVVSSWSGLIPGVGSIGLCVAGTEHAAAAEAQPESTATEPKEVESTTSCAHRTDGLTTFHPILRAPTADLNLTVALALISFFFTEFWGFKTQGIGYLKKFFINPFKHGMIQTFVGLIELISEFVRLISYSFRLFGNIFAGEVVLLVMAYLFPTLLSLPFYGLELFVGFIQAFVFAILTMVFTSMATESHDHAADGHAEAGVAAH
jgi:F-type H+-transporting ATPase subunit a